MFRTADAAAYLGLSNSTASLGLAVCWQRPATCCALRHGPWAVPGKLDPLALASHLTAPFPSYVLL